MAANGQDTNSRELFEDLFQCGYIAMAEAVDSFDSTAESSFSTWYAYYFRREVYSLMGWRSVLDPVTGKYAIVRKDAISHADSLDAPLGDDPDGGTVGDLVADSADLYEEADSQIWHEQLRNRLSAALDLLPPEQSNTIRGHFFRGETISAMAQKGGVKREVVWNRECKGLRKIRKSKAMCELRPFIHTDDIYAAATKGNGVGTFRHTGMSSTERIVIAMDEGKEI